MAEPLGVACVVDSSLALLAEWSRVMPDYIVPLLQRLYDTGRPLRLAFVCYASAATQPTPLLSKLGFAPPQTIVKDLRDDPTRLGVGHTGSGGGRGMAVLEGLVAAVELIDAFKSTAEKAVCHIIHVAASPPDAAERPLWNMSPRLDSITWDSLPQEIHKRDIKYSHVLLSSIQKLSAFHSAVAGASAQSTWFPVRSHHSVRLAGYPPPKAAGVKRPHEAPSSLDAHPDAKRPRVLSATQSPKPNPSPQASSPPQAQPSPSPVVPPANVAVASRSNTMVSFTPAALQKAAERIAETEKHLKQKMAEAAAFQHAGRMQEADALRAQIQPEFQAFRKMRQFMDQARAKLAQDLQHSQQTAGAGQTAKIGSSVTSATAGAALAPTITIPAGQQSQFDAPSVGSVPTAATSPEHQVVSSTALGPPQGLNKAQDVQLQKLVEQQQRLTPHTAAAVVPPPQPPAIPGPSQPTMQTQPVTAVPSALSSSKSWEGTLTWRGLEHATHARTDMQTRVILISAPNQELNRPETWPSTLSLAPSKERSIPWFLLQDWLKRASAVAFLLQPRDIAGEDKAKNEEHFRALVRLLSEKKIYALSGWHGPDGKAQQVVIFPTKGGLAGGYFANGMPELPATHISEIELDSVPGPIAMLLMRLPPAQLANLNKLPVEKRKQWLTAVAVKTQQAQMQAQGMGGAPGAPGGGDGAGGASAGMTTSAVLSAMAGHQRTAGGGGLPMPAAGTINTEMLQSFITRTGQPL